MARRKKKPTGKQLKQQHQAAIEQKRRERSWRPAKPGTRRPPDDLVEDTLPLLSKFGDPNTFAAANMERLMEVLWDSRDLSEEPEFEDIIVDPLRCTDALVTVGEELGIDPDTLTRLPDEERQDAQLELMEAITRRLLTDELCQAILDGLNRMRLRLKQAGQRNEAARAAFLQFFLRDTSQRDIWSTTGLVLAIVARSLAAGLELAGASLEAMEAEEAADRSPTTLWQRLSQSDLVEKASTLLERVPGLGRFVQKQADQIWEEGMEALFKGKLYLELFTEEELAGGFDLLPAKAAGATDQASAESAVTQETSKTFISDVDDYLTRLFTPDRLDQLRARLNGIASDPDCPKDWMAFLLMAAHYLAEEDAVENEKGLLMSAFLGEMRLAAKKARDDVA